MLVRPGAYQVPERGLGAGFWPWKLTLYKAVKASQGQTLFVPFVCYIERSFENIPAVSHP
jgi:hypothetical protein